MRKPRVPFGIRLPRRVGLMALLDESNLLKPVLTGIKVTPDTFDAIVKEVKLRKRGLALEVLEDYEKG